MLAIERIVSIALLGQFAGTRTQTTVIFETGRGWFVLIVAAYTQSRCSHQIRLWNAFWESTGCMVTFSAVFTLSNRKFGRSRMPSTMLQYLKRKLKQRLARRSITLFTLHRLKMFSRTSGVKLFVTTCTTVLTRTFPRFIRISKSTRIPSKYGSTPPLSILTKRRLLDLLLTV
jgi:hypothetical protein